MKRVEQCYTTKFVDMSFMFELVAISIITM